MSHSPTPIRNEWTWHSAIVSRCECRSVENNYKIISLTPFRTKEMLTISFVDGDIIEIQVTDAIGTAYAILDKKGVLTLFRSTDIYTAGTNKTAVDIDGNSYTGRLYTDIETTNSNDSSNCKWYSQRSSVKSVVTIANQEITPKNCCYWFDYCSNCTSINLTYLNTTMTTNMYQMFHNCRNITNIEVSGFNTSNVTNMASMFQSCSSLTNIDVSRFNTTNVTSMSWMFSYCTNLTNIDLSKFDTSNVTNMASMFQNCSSLTNLDISKFNTSNVTNMASMFQSCSNITSLDLSVFNTNNVTDMKSMFFGCSKLTNIDISGFNTSNVTNMNYMFAECSSLTNLDISKLNTNNVTNMGQMFKSCSNLTSLDVSKFDTSKVTNMSSMFSYCTNLTSLDVSRFNTSSATDMSTIFIGCRQLTSIDVSKFDTSNTENMYGIFYGCTNLTNIDVSRFNTDSATNISYMFYDCSSLSNIDLSNFNTTHAQNMGRMFDGCSNLKSVILGQNFRFSGDNMYSTIKPLLPTPPSFITRGTTYYTQKWINEDIGISYSPQELSDNYNGFTMAGTWTWEERTTKYTIKFVSPTGTSGSMPNQKIEATESGIINKSNFTQFDYHFDHWNGSDGNVYTDEQEIPANTFDANSFLILTAVMTRNNHNVNFVDGEYTKTLHSNEKITLPNLPGGCTYQILEETPSGWQVISQTDVAGTVPANNSANAVYTNEYVPGTATITLVSKKTMDNHVPEDGAFTFELLQNDTVIDTKTNDATGMVVFDQLTFTQPGIYAYQVREVRGDDVGISYDPHTEDITVNVQDDGAGNLTASSTALSDIPEFINESKPGTLTITKQTDGSGTGNEIFTFEITLEDEYGRPLDEITILQDTN